MYFDTSVHIIVDLIEVAHDLGGTIYEDETEITTETDAHCISVLIYFCTLRELLLNDILMQLCFVQKIPKSIYKRLLEDNRSYTQRQDKLLPSLTGKSWNELIREATSISTIDYRKTKEFIKKAVKARNKFMHEGEKWGIDNSLADECMENVWPLINLHIAIHNKYVHQHCI